MPETQDPPSYLTSAQVAERWGLSIKQIQSLRYRGTGPEYVTRYCTCVLYAADVVLRWERDHPDVLPSE